MEQTDLKKKESREQNKEKKTNCVGRFLAVAVLVVMLAAGWFLLWAYVSYNLRLSADVIRAGLVLLYILPCWIGGRVLYAKVCSHLWSGTGNGVLYNSSCTDCDR